MRFVPFVVIFFVFSRICLCTSRAGGLVLLTPLFLCGSFFLSLPPSASLPILPFKKNQDPNSSVVQEREPAIRFKPQTLQEFMSHTDRPNSIPALPKNLQQVNDLKARPGNYDPDNQGFFTLTLPGEVVVQEDPGEGGGSEGNVLVQMRNHDK